MSDHHPRCVLDNEGFVLYGAVDSALSALNRLYMTEHQLTESDLGGLVSVISVAVGSMYEQVEADYAELESYRSGRLLSLKKGKIGG